MANNKVLILSRLAGTSLEHFFRVNRYLVFGASKREEALEKAKDVQPGLVLLDDDFETPMTWHLIRLIKRESPQSKVFALLDSKDERTLKITASMGSDGFFIKPVREIDLVKIIPSTVSEEQPEATVAPLPEKPGNKPPKILVVDDEQPIVRCIAEWFEQKNQWPTLTATDADQALRLVKQEKPDLVLLDINMSGTSEKSGHDILAEVLELSPSTKVIMLTGEKEKEFIERSMKLGAVDYVTKPMNFDDLESRIKKALGLK